MTFPINMTPWSLKVPRTSFGWSLTLVNLSFLAWSNSMVLAIDRAVENRWYSEQILPIKSERRKRYSEQICIYKIGAWIYKVFVYVTSWETAAFSIIGINQMVELRSSYLPIFLAYLFVQLSGIKLRCS